MAAATIFMAFVICWVETTELILFFTSFRLATCLSVCLPAYEAGLIIFFRFRSKFHRQLPAASLSSRVRSREVERNFLYDLYVRILEFPRPQVFHDVLVLRTHDLQEILFKILHLVYGHLVHIPAR